VFIRARLLEPDFGGAEFAMDPFIEQLARLAVEHRTPFKDDNDAVLRGNDTNYGLAAAVWTRRQPRASCSTCAERRNRLDQLLQQHRSDFAVRVYKQSGIGRELGKHAIDLYTQVKSVYLKLQ
jgi:acyl-CoA reductase-like NAD-dependent aldehyde dehydrogenase